MLTKFSNLIDSVSGQWDEDLVLQSFWEVDARRILAIPLPSQNMPDFLAWNLTKN